MPAARCGIELLNVLCSCLQARNIAITVRTIIVGLMYLATFIFSANALGLSGAASGRVLSPGCCDTLWLLPQPEVIVSATCNGGNCGFVLVPSTAFFKEATVHELHACLIYTAVIGSQGVSGFFQRAVTVGFRSPHIAAPKTLVC